MNEDDKQFWIERFNHIEQAIRDIYLHTESMYKMESSLEDIEQSLEELVILKKKEVYGLDYYVPGEEDIIV